MVLQDKILAIRLPNRSAFVPVSAWIVTLSRHAVRDVPTEKQNLDSLAQQMAAQAGAPGSWNCHAKIA
jgi:hypothetical protein